MKKHLTPLLNHRKSRKRGGGKIKQVPIFIALDRSGVVSHKVFQQNTKENIQAQLKPLLSSANVLIDCPHNSVLWFHD